MEIYANDVHMFCRHGHFSGIDVTRIGKLLPAAAWGRLLASAYFFVALRVMRPALVCLIPFFVQLSFVNTQWTVVSSNLRLQVHRHLFSFFTLFYDILDRNVTPV